MVMKNPQKFLEDEEGIRDFNGWLESISFVDKKGVFQSPTLEDDDSPDPEGDAE